jgi:type I restriction enzyme, S subunit
MARLVKELSKGSSIEEGASFGNHNGILPKEWKFLKLRDIARIRSGGTPSRSNSQKYFTNGLIPWVKTMDLNNSIVIKTDECITEDALRESSCQLLPSGAVLVAMYGGFRQIGRTGILSKPSAVNQAISALEIDREKALPEFVLSWLNAQVHHWRRFAASSRKDPNITGSDVAGFPIFLPPPPRTKKNRRNPKLLGQGN